jgi:Uma2 family endonuclease
MALQLKTHLFSSKEYLTWERQAEAKHEYYRGEIYAMAGATRKHNLIAGNVLGVLHLQLRKRPCEVYPSDMRVKITPTGLYTYPDVVVVCDRPQFDDDERDTLLNPTVLVEVSSPSTEDYDRGDKFAHYRTLASLVDYLLIAQERLHVEHYQRQPGGAWLLREYRALDQVVEIASIGCQLTLADVYQKVTIEATVIPLRPSQASE